MSIFICVSRCLFVHVCIYVPISETMMADCTINNGKALETNCVTPRCCLYLNFEPLIVYIYIHLYYMYYMYVYIFMWHVDSDKGILCIILEWMFLVGAPWSIYLTPPFKIRPVAMCCIPRDYNKLVNVVYKI